MTSVHDLKKHYMVNSPRKRSYEFTSTYFVTRKVRIVENDGDDLMKSSGDVRTDKTNIGADEVCVEYTDDVQVKDANNVCAGHIDDSSNIDGSCVVSVPITK